MSPNPFSGPNRCIMAPNKSMATKKLILMVAVIMTANLLNVMIFPPNKKIPDPNVVMNPLKIETPIS